MGKTFVLVVDDDEDICFMLSQFFSNNNYLYFTVNSINAAKSVLTQVVPTHIFLDNNLPDGKGFDFIDFIKINYPGIKIIFSTGNYDLTLSKSFPEGYFNILKKPFTLNDLTESIYPPAPKGGDKEH